MKMKKNEIDLSKIKENDYQNPIEVSPGLFWVGYKIENDDFQCHPYLLVNGKNSVLFDPGSTITFHETFRKIEEVIPFSHIRYFVCHHQDPDITGALSLIDRLTSRKDAVIVSHWRAIALLKHLEIKMPFICVEENNWNLDLGDDKSLNFIFSPYLHFPGAFVTYIKENKALLSSDIFGAISKDFKLIAKDESCYEGIKLFHEHYMPSRELLLNFLLKLENVELDLILPQHGSIIPGHLIAFVINRLKEIECGIYTLAHTSTEIVKLSRLNKLLSDIKKAIILSSDFNQIIRELLLKTGDILQVEDLYFISQLKDGELIVLDPSNKTSKSQIEEAEACKKYFGKTKKSWTGTFAGSFTSLNELKGIGNEDVSEVDVIIVPLMDLDEELIIGFLHLTMKRKMEIDDEASKTIVNLCPTLSAALERELINIHLEKEKKQFYEISIKDSLTGLYTRFYMQEMLDRLCKMQDRDDKYKVGIIYYDIDDFKNVNDTFGHSAGDEVLKKVARVIIDETRGNDIQVRLGGEELGIIFLSNDWEQSFQLADRIRVIISEMDFSANLKNHKITVSGGIALRNPGESINDVFNRADKSLYEAKKTGKNRIVKG